MTYKNKDYSISAIRLIAMISIVICHMLQYYDNYLCEWFNIGVQIFLCISGYLYGKREKPNSVSMYLKNRLLRIYVEYFLVVVFYIILYFVYHPEYITPILAVKMIIGYDTVIGGGHLWYIPTILLCSLLTLLYWDLYSEKTDDKIFTVRCIAIAFLQIIVFETFFSFFNSAWINCYFMGFILGCLTKNKYMKLYKQFAFLLIILAAITNSVQLYVDLVAGTSGFSSFTLGCYHRFCNYAHLCLGVSLFIIIKDAQSRFSILNRSNRLRTILDLSDKYSYEIYLTHQFFILGPFSLMAITKSNIINITIIILAIILSAFILFRINKKLQFALEYLWTRKS